MSKNSPKSWGPFDQDVKLGTVTKVEKLRVWSRQQKKVVAEEKNAPAIAVRYSRSREWTS